MSVELWINAVMGTLKGHTYTFMFIYKFYWVIFVGYYGYFILRHDPFIFTLPKINFVLIY